MAYTSVSNFLEELANQTRTPRTFAEYLTKKYGKDEDTLPWCLWEAEVSWWAALNTRQDKEEASIRLVTLEIEEESYSRLRAYTRLILKYDKINKSLSPEEIETRDILSQKYPKVFCEESGYYSKYYEPVTDSSVKRSKKVPVVKEEVFIPEIPDNIKEIKIPRVSIGRQMKVKIPSNIVLDSPSYDSEAVLLEY